MIRIDKEKKSCGHLPNENFVSVCAFIFQQLTHYIHFYNKCSVIQWELREHVIVRGFLMIQMMIKYCWIVTHCCTNICLVKKWDTCECGRFLLYTFLFCVFFCCYFYTKATTIDTHKKKTVKITRSQLLQCEQSSDKNIHWNKRKCETKILYIVIF